MAGNNVHTFRRDKHIIHIEAQRRRVASRTESAGKRMNESVKRLTREDGQLQR